MPEDRCQIVARFWLDAVVFCWTTGNEILSFASSIGRARHIFRWQPSPWQVHRPPASKPLCWRTPPPSGRCCSSSRYADHPSQRPMLCPVPWSFRSDQVASATEHPSMLAGCRVAVITDLLTVTAPTKSPSWLPTMDACEPESKAAVPVKVRRRVNEWVTDRGLVMECPLQFVGALIQLAIRSTASRSMPMKPCQCRASQTLPVGFSPPLTMISFLVCAFFNPRRMAGTSCG